MVGLGKLYVLVGLVWSCSVCGHHLSYCRVINVQNGICVGDCNVPCKAACLSSRVWEWLCPIFCCLTVIDPLVLITRVRCSCCSQPGHVCRCVGVIIQKSPKDRCCDPVIGISQAFCMYCDVLIGIAVFAHAIQILFASVTVWFSVLCIDLARMAFWSGSVAAAEAKKTEGTSMHALLTPRLPMWTGRVAWLHCLSSSSTLRTNDSHVLVYREKMPVVGCQSKVKSLTSTVAWAF